MKIVVHPDFSELADFIAELPQRFENEGEVIYTGRNILKRYQIKGYEIIVKRFRKPNIFNKYIYSNFRKSKARRSYEYAFKLLDAGIGTPQPIAYREDKKGIQFRYSYYIAIFETEYTHIRNQMLGNGIDAFFIEQLAIFIARIHEKGILFLDLSPGNILFKRSGNDVIFSLVDINRTYFRYRLSFNQRCRNFKRLTRRDDILEQLASFYAVYSHLDRSETIDRIFKYCHQFYKNK